MQDDRWWAGEKGSAWLAHTRAAAGGTTVRAADVMASVGGRGEPPATRRRGRRAAPAAAAGAPGVTSAGGGTAGTCFLRLLSPTRPLGAPATPRAWARRGGRHIRGVAADQWGAPTETGDGVALPGRRRRRRHRAATVAAMPPPIPRPRTLPSHPRRAGAVVAARNSAQTLPTPPPSPLAHRGVTRRRPWRWWSIGDTAT